MVDPMTRESSERAFPVSRDVRVGCASALSDRPEQPNFCKSLTDDEHSSQPP
jgi:hypothetical protein